MKIIMKNKENLLSELKIILNNLFESCNNEEQIDAIKKDIISCSDFIADKRMGDLD